MVHVQLGGGVFRLHELGLGQAARAHGWLLLITRRFYYYDGRAWREDVLLTLSDAANLRAITR